MSAHRCDQQSERLLICTHLRITVWVIVPDNPNYAWVRSTLSASSVAPCTLVAAVPECFCHSYTWEWSLTWRHHRFTNPHFTLGCSPLWLFRITSYFPRTEHVSLLPLKKITRWLVQSVQLYLGWKSFYLCPHLTKIHLEREALTLSVAVMHCSFICFR